MAEEITHTEEVSNHDIQPHYLKQIRGWTTLGVWILFTPVGVWLVSKPHAGCMPDGGCLDSGFVPDACGFSLLSLPVVIFGWVTGLVIDLVRARLKGARLRRRFYDGLAVVALIIAALYLAFWFSYF
jgi:uncharacterized RDD family membrane protein YckC